MSLNEGNMGEFQDDHQSPGTQAIDPGVIAAIVTARQDGKVLHDFVGSQRPEGVTEALAALGVYTHQEARDPGSFWTDFEPKRETERELGKLAANACVALETIPEFAQASKEKRLGTTLVDVFDAVQDIKIEDVHVADQKYDEQGKLIGGAVTNGLTTFSVNSPQEGVLLSSALAALTRTDDLSYFHEVRTSQEAGKTTISVANLNEFTVRVLEAAIARIVADEDLAKGLIATTLPLSRIASDKARADGETYHPAINARIDRVQASYQALGERIQEQTYRQGTPHTSLKVALARKPYVLVSSPAASFEVLRKGYNAVIKAMRGDGRLNQEQNPNKSRRLLIEKGVRLKRKPGVLNQPGPPDVRSYRAAETVWEKGREAVTTRVKHPIKSIAKAISKVIGIGFELIIDGLAEGTPWAKNRGKLLMQDRRAWRAQKQAAQATGQRIDEVLTQLRR